MSKEPKQILSLAGDKVVKLSVRPLNGSSAKCLRPISALPFSTQDSLECDLSKRPFSAEYLHRMETSQKLFENLIKEPIEKNKSPQKLHLQNWLDEKQIPDLSALNIDALFKDESDKKFDEFFRDLGEKPKPKVKFTQINTTSDDVTTEVQTWIGSEKKSSEEVQNWLQNDDVTKDTNKSKFLDFLNSVDDLEKDLNFDNILEDLPQHDVQVSSLDTNDDIAAILKVLEEEDKKSQQKMETMKSVVQTEISPEVKKVSVGTPDIIITEVPETKSEFDSSSYSKLVSFLDAVDSNCSVKVLPTVQQQIPKIDLDTIPKIENLILLSPEHLAQYIIDLSLKTKDKTSSIALLQKELSELRNQILTTSKKTDQNLKEKLRKQKEEYEATIKRHQKFIDQLILDKKSLNQQCESLVLELKALEERHASNIKAIEHKHHVEMQKVKDMQIAGEKIRRERWIDTKTKKIKEMTVKSIEPELQSMEKRQQMEIADLRILHRKELEELELKAARRTQQQLEDLRKSLEEEREKTIEHEREIVRKRYEKMVENEENSLQQQRKRLLQEHASRIAELEEKSILLCNEKERGIRQAQEDFEERLQVVIRRHADEIKLIKDRAFMDMETWKNEFKKQQESLMEEREKVLKEALRRDRDKEIETVLERLEMEANENKRLLEEAADNRVRRLKTKYEKEMTDLEETEKETKMKLFDLRKKLAQTEDVVIGLRTSLEQTENHLASSQNLVTKLQGERDEMKEIVRKELKIEMESVEKELSRMKSTRDEEIQRLYSRVKISIARKDEILEELKRDNNSLQEKCLYLENMLEQQRKEFFIK